MIEVTRGNHVSTRNQRLAALHTFYRYVGLQYPEMLAEAQRVGGDSDETHCATPN
jgi:hypothetical protein